MRCSLCPGCVSQPQVISFQGGFPGLLFLQKQIGQYFIHSFFMVLTVNVIVFLTVRGWFTKYLAKIATRCILVKLNGSLFLAIKNTLLMLQSNTVSAGWLSMCSILITVLIKNVCRFYARIPLLTVYPSKRQFLFDRNWAILLILKVTWSILDIYLMVGIQFYHFCNVSGLSAVGLYCGDFVFLYYFILFYFILTYFLCLLSLVVQGLWHFSFC